MTSLKSNMKGLMLSSALRSSLLNTSTALAIALAATTTFAIQARSSGHHICGKRHRNRSWRTRLPMRQSS